MFNAINKKILANTWFKPIGCTLKNKKICVVGFGNIGSFLFNELKNKSKEIQVKTGKKISHHFINYCSS